MPLAFDSLSHGKIAFGFFNIETDLLLLNRYFFFASDFCRCLVEAGSLSHEGDCGIGLDGIVRLEEDQDRRSDGGDSRGGFPGIYRRGLSPLSLSAGPRRLQAKPEGFQTRSVLEPILTDYGRAEDIPVRFRQERKRGRHRGVSLRSGKFSGIDFLHRARRLSPLA